MASPTDEPPDIMNEPAFDPPSAQQPPPPPRRRSTITSQASTTGTLNPDTCRICRSEGSTAEPLFHPCKCSGSIKFVHQECLIEWLGHSNKKHCELCKTPFRFTKLYDAHMPSTLPLGVFVKRAAWHVVRALVRMTRLALVGTVWFGVIPWIVRWVWRWLFWLADAAWSREAFMELMKRQSEGKQSAMGLEWISRAFQEFFAPLNESAIAFGGQQQPFMISLAQDFGLIDGNATNGPMLTPDEPSMLSDWTYLSAMTDSKRMNRLILDVFEGQLITCVILTSFILVFLLREWVVQQQPLVNLDGLNNAQNQLREAAERMAADNERLRRQQELLDQARRRLVELQNDADTLADALPASDLPSFEGWESLEKLIDETTLHLRQEGELENDLFLAGAQKVTQQIRAAGKHGEELDEFTEKVYKKLASYPDAERREWEGVLVSEIEKNASKRAVASSPESATFADGDVDEASESATARPPMPARDFSSRATQIQRLLHEADGVFPPGQGPAAERTRRQQESPPSSADAPQGPANLSQRTTDEADATARPQSLASDSDSWEQVTPPARDSNAPGDASIASVPSLQEKNPQAGEPSPTNVPARFATMPVANAGPDARINIRQSPFLNDAGRTVQPAAPRIEERMLAEDELKKNLEAEVAKELENEKKESEQSGQSEASEQAAEQPDQDAQAQTGNDDADQNDNPFHPEGPDPPPRAEENAERRASDSFGSRVASAFREEFGIDEMEELENMRAIGLDNDEQPTLERGNFEANEARDENRPDMTTLEKVMDWLWGDIRPANAQEPVPPAREEIQGVDERREGENGQEAPFVPMQDGQPAAAQQPQQQQPEGNNQADANDPEVVAAAQQAGLDAEAVEDAEDLEGIFELIGVQGPLIGLFQTSAFCMLLVACTITGAVFAPYVWGKVCLSLLDNPVYFLLVMPLQIASFFADVIADLGLLLGGWAVLVLSLAMDWLDTGLKTLLPSLTVGPLWEQAAQYSGNAASKAGGRLAAVVASSASVSSAQDWDWAFLGASMHAHASLQTIQAQIRMLLDVTGHAITTIVDTISSGQVLSTLGSAVAHLPSLAAQLFTLATSLPKHTRPLLTLLTNLLRGRLPFTTPSVPLDPTLIYWSTTDRTAAIAFGYLSLAMLAAVYTLSDTTLTSTPSSQNRERALRQSLRQAGGVLKVILIISIEMLVFPLYCGILLDFAFLPLFANGSVRSRWTYATQHPWIFGFGHWFVGTAYMFHFALFVGMCRKILRRGVLWFIRDPDDPEFHPVRDVLEKNVVTQLRKIAFSALVYGALVILCLGGVIWGIGQAFRGIFPIHWTSAEPVLEFPLDLLLCNFATPLVIRLFRPSKVINAMYAWWLRRCARFLRLSHFLFDDRQKDEEGSSIDWTDWRSVVNVSLSSSSPTEDPQFRRSGTYVLTPSTDSYRPPKPNEAFLHADGSDVYIADSAGKRNDNFAKVYVPPWFRVRIAIFMVCLWGFSAGVGLGGGLVPLVLGRWLVRTAVSRIGGGLWVNDIYAYLIGAYLLGGIGFAIWKGGDALAFAKRKASEAEVRAAVQKAIKFGSRCAKCAYVYGFLGLVLPVLMALMLHFYLVLPLATWTAFLASSGTDTADASSFSSTPGSDPTSPAPAMNITETFFPLDSQAQLDSSSGKDTTLHLIQSHALGLLYVRIFSRTILTAPSSRAAEGLRRVTAKGYLDPDPRLATRYFILPVTFVCAALLCGPPLVAQLLVSVTKTLPLPSSLIPAYQTSGSADEEPETLLFRSSYALTALLGLAIWGGRALARGTKRWRARIRDEVYLVGERLHNFGEGRPPAGVGAVGVGKRGRGAT